jgi:hypothetical protein
MAKSRLPVVDKLHTIRSNFSVGLYCFCFINRLTREEIAARDRVIVGEDGVHCVPQSKRVPPEAGKFYEVGFGGPGALNTRWAAMEYSKMLLRSFTVDCFEAIRNYCGETNQLDVLKAQPWFEFVRMMRNSLTHTQQWHFRKYDRHRLPVTWRDKTIELGLEGMEPDFDFYDWWDGCELWEEMNEFAKTLK